jgi:hypothetical protein
MKRFSAVSRLVALTMLMTVTAGADTGYGKLTLGKWKASDKCAHGAQAAFPDFTPESNAKRDAALRKCLEQGRLPPRDSLTPGH